MSKRKHPDRKPPFKLDLMTSRELMELPPETTESLMFRAVMASQVPDAACMVRQRPDHRLYFCLGCRQWHRGPKEPAS